MNRWLYVSLSLTILALAAASYVYVNRAELLENQVATHWNIKGQPDALTPRDRMLPQLLMLPGAMIFVIALTFLLPRISPRHYTVDEFRDTFNYLMMLVVALLAYCDAVILTVITHPEQARNGTLDINRLLMTGIFPFFALLGNLLGKVRRNFWMGIRTPWTLASEAVWTQTHRVAAWIFVAVGLIGWVLAMANLPVAFCIGLLLGGALVPVGYSLWLYKRLERAGKL